MKKIISILLLCLASLMGIFLYEYQSFHDGRLHIVICDIGQGDAILIRTPKGADILIDGGPSSQVLGCLASNMPFWDRKIEAIIMTHPDADHSAGLVDVVERYQVMEFGTQKMGGKTQIYESLRAILAEKDLSARYLYQNETITEESGLRLTTLWPSVEAVQEAEQTESNGKKAALNELSVVELLEYGDFRALFTGDAGSKVMDEIAASAGDIDFLKVPHHGSATGMSAYFLGTTTPEIAAISAGRKNRYGHPRQISLDLLENASVKTLRTDLEGEIEIISDGKTWSYRTDLN